MSDKSSIGEKPDKTRAKIITAVILFAWVIFVFTFTIFKLSGGKL